MGAKFVQRTFNRIMDKANVHLLVTSNEEDALKDGLFVTYGYEKELTVQMLLDSLGE